MKISLRHFAISCLFLSFLISGCEKATSLADTVKQALDREVVDENAEPPIDPADIPPPPEPVAMGTDREQRRPHLHSWVTTILLKVAPTTT